MILQEKINQLGWKKLIAISISTGAIIVIVGALVHGAVQSDRAAQNTVPSPSPSPMVNCPDRIKHDTNPAPLWIKGNEQKRISGEEETLIMASCASPSPVASPSAATSPKVVAKPVSQPTASKPTPASTVAPPPPSPSPSTSPTPSQASSACNSNPNPVFTNQLIEPEKVTDITTPPNIAKPSDHLKTHSYVDTASPGVPLYAPIDMELVSGAHYVGGPYMYDFRVSCEVTLRLAHVTDPISKLKDALPAEPKNSSTSDEVKPPIAVKAGELIAYSGGPPHVPNSGLDFGVYNSTKPNRYAATQTSLFYTTAVCPFDYFPESIRTAYKPKFDIDRNDNMVADGESFCQ